MKRIKHTKLLILAGILLQAFAFPLAARAQGIVYGDTIPAGTVIDQDIVLVGQNVSIAGTVNGNVIILGNQVKIDGLVNGSLIMIGQNAAIAGTVTGGTYAVALTLELSPTAVLERDLYVTTVSLVSGRDSQIQRDLLAVGLDAGLGGRVGRDHYTAIGPIQLYNGLTRLLGFEELTLQLHFELPQPTTTPSPAPPATPTHTPTPISKNDFSIHDARLQYTISNTQYVVRHKLHSLTNLSQINPLAQSQPFDWNQWALDSSRNWAVLSFFGLLAFWLFRQPLEHSGEPLRLHPWQTTAKGLLVFVISINLFGVAILLAALIFSIGLGLNYVGLWQLSLALWIAAYASLALAMTALWFLIVYGTKIIAVYVLFIWLFNKTTSAPWIKVLAILVGMLVFVLLRSMPYIGWVIGVLITAAGMGSAWLAYRTTKHVSPSPLPAKSRATRKSRRSI